MIRQARSALTSLQRETQERAKKQLSDYETVSVAIQVTANQALEINPDLNRYYVTGRILDFDVDHEPEAIGGKIFVNAVTLKAKKIKAAKLARRRATQEIVENSDDAE